MDVRRVNIEVILIASFVILCLVATNVNGQIDSGTKSHVTVFGTLWRGFRWILIKFTRQNKPISSKQTNITKIDNKPQETVTPTIPKSTTEKEAEVTPTPEPTVKPEEIEQSSDDVAEVEELVGGADDSDLEIIDPISTDEKNESEIQTDIYNEKSQDQDIDDIDISLAANDSIVESKDETSTLVEEKEELLPLNIPSPTPELELAGPIDQDRILKRLEKIQKKLKKRLNGVSQSTQLLNRNLDKIADQETEVDIYLAKTQDRENRENRLLSKFDSYLEGISIAKGDSGMWESIWKDGKSEFQFRARDFNSDHSVSKISFGYVPDRKCVLKKFHVKISKGGEDDVITNTWQLKQSLTKGQNYSLPYPVMFDKLTIVVTENYGDEETVCVPTFRLYQPVGLMPIHV